VNNDRCAKAPFIALAIFVAILVGCAKSEAPAPAAATAPPPPAEAPEAPAPDATSPPDEASPPEPATNAQQPEPEPVPAPTGSSAPHHLKFSGAPSPATKKNVVQVFFGTDRSYRAANPVASQFGPGRGAISYGTAEVSIPPDHRMGNLESPSLIRLEFAPDPKKHVVLQKISVLPANEYFRLLADTVQGAPGKSALVFVHGYNVTFADAARRTAQMTYDLQFPGAPIFFSWPSVGKTQDYAVDENNVEWARPHLTQFLVDVLSKTNATDVYLIAHSMGNRALANSVADVEANYPQLRAKIREIILAAPDIDADTFKDEIAPRIIAAESATTHLTLYASSRDEALLASKKFHGYPRAGDAGDLQLVLAGLEYIDASSVDTGFLGHSYYGENRSVIADIHYLIDDHLRACKRFSLKEIQVTGGNRCVFAH
jgi:esterase/lipase superfamily enzyme